ncbi:hypothetical protein [Rhodococcus marinonascens]|uniref:hypothetical protein n=1 Tax=Rhodococcus marinonascens TaxID=38311 RepID=UPI000AED2DAF|nr:hypothetical protein [Rhodococcus marinonascens]
MRATNPVIRTQVLYKVGGESPYTDPYPAQGVDPAATESTLDLGVRDGDFRQLRDGTVALSTDAAFAMGADVGETVPLRLGDGTSVAPKVVATYSRGLGFGDVTLPASQVRAHTTTGLVDVLLVSAQPGRIDDAPAAITAMGGVAVSDRAEFAAAPSPIDGASTANSSAPTDDVADIPEGTAYDASANPSPTDPAVTAPASATPASTVPTSVGGAQGSEFGQPRSWLQNPVETSATAGSRAGSGSGAVGGYSPGFGGGGYGGSGYGTSGGQRAGGFGTPVTPGAPSAPGSAPPGSAPPGRGAAGTTGGTRGMGAMGMGGMGAARGQGDDNKEHQTPDYLINIDNGNELIGTLPPVAPPVIGG